MLLALMVSTGGGRVEAVRYRGRRDHRGRWNPLTSDLTATAGPSRERGFEMAPRSFVSVLRRIGVGRLVACWTVCLLIGLFAAAPAGAQMVMNSTDHLSFDRPESWALKYFTAATLLGGLDTPQTQKPWSVSIGLEAGLLPPLSRAQQLVGYDGTEAQDLNKAPFLPRPRVTIALPGRLSLVVAGVPPFAMFGLRAKLLAFALERPVYETPALAVGLRAYGQAGTVRGSYTCPASTLAFAPGSAGNIDGCQAASSDTASLRYVGGEASVAYRPQSRLSPHVAIGLTYMDVGFQVGALTYGMIDHTHYLSKGMAVSGSGGVSYRLTSRLSLSTDAFYSPLSVRRGPGAPLQNDGMFNVRALVTYRMR
jgi:hypothetical protein